MEIIANSVSNLASSLESLAVISLIFCLLLFLLKGKGLIKELMSEKKEFLFNIKVVSMNAIITTPILMYFDDLIDLLPFMSELNAWNQIPTLMLLIITVFMGDFIAYWRHRFEHSIFLWPSHSMHHSDTAMNWTTLERMHPINRASTFLIDHGVLLLLGFPTWAVIVNNLIRHYYGYFIHLNVPWNYGIFGKIFVSPVMHQWHHALDKEGHNANFTTVFSIIDVVFGTFYLPNHPPKSLGVAYYSGGGSFIRQVLYPFKPSSYSRIWQWKSKQWKKTPKHSKLR